MKKICTILLLMISVHLYAPNPKECIWLVSISYKNIELENKKLDILRSIISVEKPHTIEQAKAAKIREDAVGIIQIRPIMVQTVNQILGYNKYWLSDRTDSIKSVEMFMIYQEYYNPNWDQQKAALLWNMGSNYKNATAEQMKRGLKYWEKVRKNLNKV